jgi:dephospho-CoA kinase
MAHLRVGLTGGIAAGKSTVAGWLRESGFAVLDADEIVAELYRPDEPGAAAVAALFGPAMLTSAGGVDHARLAERIFHDAKARERLEQAIHPLVREIFEGYARRVDDIVILEAPLLVEAGFAPDFDLVVTVEAATETRIQRAVERGLDAQEVRRRLAAQTDETTRTRVAHRVLRNDGTLSELRRQVDTLIADIRERAGGGS